MIPRSPKTKVRRQMLFRLMKLQKTHPSMAIGKVTVEAVRILLNEFAEKIVPDREIREIVRNPKLDFMSQQAHISDLLLKQRKLSKEDARKVLQRILAERDSELPTVMVPNNYDRLLKRMGADTPKKMELFRKATAHQIGTVESALLKPISEALYNLK